MRKPDAFYEDAVPTYKTTLNIPIPVMRGGLKRMKRVQLKYFNVYVTALIDRDIRENSPITLDEFLGLRSKEVWGLIVGVRKRLYFDHLSLCGYLRRIRLSAREKSAIDPPRRFEGFIGGLRRNSYVYTWWKKTRNQSLK